MDLLKSYDAPVLGGAEFPTAVMVFCAESRPVGRPLLPGANAVGISKHGRKTDVCLRFRAAEITARPNRPFKISPNLRTSIKILKIDL